MKKILLSLGVIVALAGTVIGGTIAFYNDTETSNGNIFVAGSIDLKVDHTKQTYNGEVCVSNCVEINDNLIENGGFEDPNVPSGGWAIYPDDSLTSWVVESGAGLEIQDNAAGAPHGGNQLAELDSNNPSVISQTLTTIPGGKYKLRFWYSPRPNRPAGDNTIGAVVQVVSDNTLLVNDTIGAASAGGSGTSWTEYVYNFIATDGSTKIKFSDLGTANSFGGYLDDVSVREMECTDGGLPNGGVCTLWGEQDLGPGDTFWNFPDIKPADWGTNVISLHVDSNDAYACLIVHDADDQENTLLDPEVDMGDDAINGNLDGFGELSNYLDLFAWNDLNANGVYEPTGETSIYEGDFQTELIQMTLTGGGPTQFVGLAWCAGNIQVDHTNGGGAITCDGDGMLNDAQSDSLSASLSAYAEQTRNNPNFSCAGVDLDGPEEDDV